jgi:hypothetical protein
VKLLNNICSLVSCPSCIYVYSQIGAVKSFSLSHTLCLQLPHTYLRSPSNRSLTGIPRTPVISIFTYLVSFSYWSLLTVMRAPLLSVSQAAVVFGHATVTIIPQRRSAKIYNPLLMQGELDTTAGVESHSIIFWVCACVCVLEEAHNWVWVRVSVCARVTEREWNVAVCGSMSNTRLQANRMGFDAVLVPVQECWLS